MNSKNAFLAVFSLGTIIGILFIIVGFLALIPFLVIKNDEKSKSIWQDIFGWVAIIGVIGGFGLLFTFIIGLSYYRFKKTIDE